mgnify:FL=1
MRKVPATSLLAIAVVLQAVPLPGAAQEAPQGDPVAAPAPDDEEESLDADTIIVTADSLRGTVDTPAPPVLGLDEAAIAA